ncbi:ImmA/IrrE family metallo-endopeptidase [Bifidobacterium sp. ESL0790]|uniref:ImmA/IrrE family metallo-endopeptidase n=1 Tax=Bifidobacterium sp. ESL0790 TaxID=2983233 RepID=UPI0023F6C0EB|nr:ImmA/IrrE family metallo-endopeptidase [Bifidobacterium sp. ESL0790]WEV71980.1 ImmA/IrrE family metallo-endopeptidase [Bifidobacterium sp. ESL0790]
MGDTTFASGALKKAEKYSEYAGERIDKAVGDDAIPAEAAIETINKLLNQAGQLHIPVDLFCVAQKLGIDVKYELMEHGQDGRLQKPEGGRFEAVLNIAQHPHRQRFTLAHELGHYVHQHQDTMMKEAVGGDNRDEISSLGVKPDEIWANRYASALLMPGAAVKSYWKNGMSRSDMAQIFNVSQQAMDLRIASLGLVDLPQQR